MEELKWKIEKNYADIVTTVKAEDIMDRFVDVDYLSIEDVVDRIMKEKTDQEQMKTLIQLLNTKSSKQGIFDFFLKQLAENRAYHVLERKIRETEKKPIQVLEAGTDDPGYPKIPEELRIQRVTPKHAMYLSRTVSSKHLLAFGTCLDFTEVEISHIEADYLKIGISEVITQLMIQWNKKMASATLGKLLDIFEKNRDNINLGYEDYVKALGQISS